MARFFIDRPIFAWVIAIILMLAGILTLRGLPVADRLYAFTKQLGDPA